MSAETATWLNTKTLIGNTDARGHAWHYRAEDQGDESNHYPGFVPVTDVERRLFNWEAESRRIAVEHPADFETMTHLDANDMPARWVIETEKQAIVNGSVVEPAFGFFAPGYTAHQYREWLLQSVANILDDDLGISSAGLLKRGGQAWVEVSVPESITTPEGIQFRANLLATTSLDGTCATTFKRTHTLTVCDNTRAIALGENSPAYKVRHSRYSKLKLAEARDALALVHTMQEEFAAEIAAQCAITIDNATFNRFMDLTVSMKDPKGQKLTGRALSTAERKRESLTQMYRNDMRVAPWAGTAFGALQLVNTFEHHVKNVQGSRADRNMARNINGEFDTVDRQAWATLQMAMA